MSETTKVCPKCGNTRLVRLSSLNVKLCTDCHTRIEWVRGAEQSRYYA